MARAGDLDLAALGQRWYGDPAHFKSWAEVGLPSNYEFFGAFGADSLDLRSDWLWRPDWRHHVIGQASANMVRDVLKVGLDVARLGRLFDVTVSHARI